MSPEALTLINMAAALVVLVALCLQLVFINMWEKRTKELSAIYDDVLTYMSRALDSIKENDSGSSKQE